MKIDKDTVIFITGAGSGLGLECATRYYKLGCKVILADITFNPDATKFIDQVVQFLK